MADFIQFQAHQATTMADVSEQGVDYFDLLPDPIVLDIFNRVLDAKSLCRCILVSKRFASLVPQIDSISISMKNHGLWRKDSRSGSKFGLFKGFVSKFVFKPIQFLTGKKLNSRGGGFDVHQSVGDAVKNFNEIQSLKIELPCFGGEFGGNNSQKAAMIPLLKWEAGFGKELEKCVILGATSISKRKEKSKVEDEDRVVESEDEHLFSDEELKLRIIWIISCLIASSARHNLVKKVLNSCPKLNSAVISDAGKQGKLCMDEEQIKELRNSMNMAENKGSETSTSSTSSSSSSTSSSSSSSQMGYVGNLVMKLWYVKELELKSSGQVMKGATMVVIRPDSKKEEKEVDGMMMKEMMKKAFQGDEMFGEAVKELLSRKEKRVYRLEMNTF